MSFITKLFHKKTTALDHPKKFEEFLGANHYGAAFWHASEILDPGERELALAKAHFTFLSRKNAGQPAPIYDAWMWPGIPSEPSIEDAKKHIVSAQAYDVPGAFALGASIFSYNQPIQVLLENEDMRQMLKQAALKDGSAQARSNLMVYYSVQQNYEEVLKYYNAGPECGEVEAVMIRLALMQKPTKYALLEHIKRAVKFGHPEGHMFYGRHLIQTGDLFHGETELRTAMRLGHPEAGALMADVLSQSIEGRERVQDINELYRHSASLGHKGAQAMIGIRTICNQVPGADKDKALQDLRTLSLAGEPLSTRFLQDTRL